jgi:site-specific DNA-methyltransferase (adenine-specific)
MAGGRGLADFRSAMLGDQHTRVLVDYANAKDLFPTLGIIGGVCYFLWDRDNPGACSCTYHRNGATVGPQERTLNEFDIFVRDARAVSILQKVLARREPTFDALVSGDTPFGLATNFADYQRGIEPGAGHLRLYANVGTTRVQGAVRRDVIRKNAHLSDAWKLFLPVAGSGRERERSGVDLVLGPSIVAEPGSVCTQTYLVVGPLKSESEAESIASYLRTRFARLLVSLRKPSQHVFRGMYKWLPQQEWNRAWTDRGLYEKYGITDDEIAFIESMIRPMDVDG